MDIFDNPVFVYNHRKNRYLFFFLVLAAWMHILPCPVDAGLPYSAYYSDETDNILWFVQITDIHIGKNDTAPDNLEWIVDEAMQVIDPSFVIASGDLTDSTNGGIIPNGPWLSEWDTYNNILSALSFDTYVDIPGNHDQYNDGNFTWFLGYSVTGSTTGETQASWVRYLGDEKYHFLGINTAGNDGDSFSIIEPYGDYAGLDTDELEYIEAQLQANSDAALTMIFGHHPFDPDTKSDTGLYYGRDELLSLIETYGVSLYSYGHTHDSEETLYSDDLTDSIFYINTDDLVSSESYRLYAIDCNSVSTKEFNIGDWPAVIITAPADLELGGENPYAYMINDSGDNPVRALVFDSEAIDSVSFRINKTGDWYPMTQDALNAYLWTGTWAAEDFEDGAYQIDVRAVGSSTVTDSIITGDKPESESSNNGNSGGSGSDGSSDGISEPEGEEEAESSDSESGKDSGWGCFIKTLS